MTRQGNAHSSLLDQIVKIAEAKDTQKPATQTFEESVSAVLNEKDKEPTLREIMAQFAPAKPMDVSDGLGGSDDPALGDLPDDIPGEVPGEVPGEGGGDIEAAKQSLAQALVDLCGSPEEATMCINSIGGEEPLGDDLGDLGDGDMPDPMGPEPMLDAGASPMEAPAPAPMPAPMEMGM